MTFKTLATGLALFIAPMVVCAQDASKPKQNTPAPLPPGNYPSTTQVVPVPGTPPSPTPPPGMRSDKPGRLQPNQGMGMGNGRVMQPYSYPTPIHPLCVGCQGLTFPPPYPNFQPPCLPCMPFQGLVPPPPGPGAGAPSPSFQFHQYTRSPRDFFMLDIPR